MDSRFEHLGWHIDYYFNRKYIGSELLEKPDREKTGYEGRIRKVLDKDLVLKGKKYKMGSIVYTECIPLCGKVVGDRLRIVEDAHDWRNVIRR
jgi:hypothetical protein